MTTPANQEILDAIHALHDDIHAAVVRIDALVKSHNQVGENVAWLTANTQGLFQMFNDPNVMNQMMSGVLGGFGGNRGGHANPE